MRFTYDQLAAQLRCPEDRTPEIVEHLRPGLELCCEIEEQVKKDFPGVSLHSPEAKERFDHYFRNGLPYEQEQG